MLLTQEEYSSEEDEEEESTSEVAAIATTFTPSSSLFESPNENLSNNKEAKCFMAKSFEVSSPSSISKNKHAMMDDPMSLKVKLEIMAFDKFVSNLQGEAKIHFETLLSQLGEARDLIELKEGFERENVLEISSLSQVLEEEQEARVSLEEKLATIEESHNLAISKLIKEHDHALAMVNLLKNEKVELQTRLSKYDIASSSNSSNNHTNLVEENARLTAELAKSSSFQGKNIIDDLLRNQRSNNGKEGIGFVSKAKKNYNNKKAKSSQAKEKNVVGGDVSKGKATRNDFAGLNNPNYVLFNDYYGNVYAQYVGPFDGYIAWSIWVPKTLVANKRGPIEKWVPKIKT